MLQIDRRVLRTQGGTKSLGIFLDKETSLLIRIKKNQTSRLSGLALTYELMNRQD
jgi:hypothetical protein